MKTVSFLSGTLMAIILFTSCKKGDDISSENKQKADEFKASVAAKKYQVKEYYADKPIDYDEQDEEVKAETDLFNYVSPWIKDDWNVFDVASGQVSISQNEHKFAGNDDEVIMKNFAIDADKDGVYFDFLNYQYQTLKYRLVEFTNEYFVVYADWHSGTKVFTKFIVIP